MFSRISASDAAALNASRTTLAARAVETTALLNVRKVDDSVDFIARFERIQEFKKSATAVAAAAQGAAKADPPAKLLITPVNIEELVAKASEANAHYYKVKIRRFLKYFDLLQKANWSQFHRAGGN